LVLKLLTSLKQICNHPAQYLKKGEISSSLSGKAQLMLNLIDNILINDEKTLIFTQYKEMGDLLTQMIQNHTGIVPLFLHGSLTRKKRDQMVEDFQTKAHCKIFILSLKAGGTGLNLTAASNVIHYDLWWNPAVEAQATDRAYRIGQKSNVMVYRPLCKGTFEERINEMLKSKKQLADMTVETGEAWIGELSNQELNELVMLS
jgi:SNF2 family DNA or RNA helicase